MTRSLPTLKSDAEAEAFVASGNLTDYDLSAMMHMRFELRRKDKTVNFRLPESLLKAVRGKAESAGIPYQRFIRLAIKQALGNAKP